VTRLECGRTRADIADHVITLAREDPSLAVGFDFSFSLPAWFLPDRGFTSAEALWDAAAVDGEAWLAACEPPFWGRPGHPRPAILEQFRVTEASLPSIGGVRAKSTFQVGGAGSVGTGSLRGFPMLARLRSEGFRVWPFHDTPRLPVAVEIYPRLFTGPVVKSRTEARRDYLAANLPHLDAEMTFDAATSEDAFDALVSAFAMSQCEAELRALPVVDDAVMRFEGCVWLPRRQPS
jgi:hypothetical protein